MYAKSPDPPVRPCLSRRASPAESPAPPPRLRASPVLKDPYRKLPQLNRNTQYEAPHHLAIRQNYSAMCENIDRGIGDILAAVDKRGELDNTIIIFTSDHNRCGKHVPYQASIGIPMVATGPGVKARRESKALVSLVDLAATFLDYANVKKPATMDRRSLRPLLTGRTKVHRSHLVSAL